MNADKAMKEFLKFDPTEPLRLYPAMHYSLSSVLIRIHPRSSAANACLDPNRSTE
jgi:hypothetical protein